MSPSRDELSDAVVVAGLSKQYVDSAKVRFDAPTPLLARLRGYRPEGGVDAAAGVGDDDDELDDEEEEEEVVATEEVRPRRREWALRDVSFTVPAGSTVGVVGPVGAGKTTLLRVLAGIELPTHGSVRINGYVSPLPSAAAQVMAPKEPALQNVLLAAATTRIPRRRVKERMAEILAFAEVPAGEARHGITRSARALAHAVALKVGADVVVLEEGDAGLTPTVGRRVAAALQEAAAGGATIVVETDDLSFVQQACDRILWLEDGEIVRYGPTAEVLPELSTRQTAGDRGARARRGFCSWASIAGVDVSRDPGEPVAVEVFVDVAATPLSVRVGVALEHEGEGVAWLEQPEGEVVLEPGTHRTTLHLPSRALAEAPLVGRVEAIVRYEERETVLVLEHAFTLVAEGDELGADPASEVVFEGG